MSNGFHKKHSFSYQKMEACKCPARCEWMSSSSMHTNAVLNLEEGGSPSLAEDREETLSLHPPRRPHQREQNIIWSCTASVADEKISSTAASPSVGHKDNRWLRCQNAGEGWLQPIYNFIILCRLQLQHLPNTPPALETPLSFLPLAWSDFILPPTPFAARLSWVWSSTVVERSGWALLGR